MLQLWGMQGTPLLPLLPGPLRPRVVAPDMGSIELNCASFTILIFPFKLYLC